MAGQGDRDSGLPLQVRSPVRDVLHVQSVQYLARLATSCESWGKAPLLAAPRNVSTANLPSRGADQGASPKSWILAVTASA
jgi:hypothetical protein